ncbi:kinase-like protein [Pyrenochaeta sp. DS3sAY3a]|nr:kinase-like protein [Pyrenochaeta sp. DS3sAY3a]
MVNALIEQSISLLLHIRTSVAKNLFGPLGPSVVRVGRDRVVKGPCQLAELEALRFIARSTSIPVPRIRRTYTYHGKLFIELQYIKGIDLESAWIQNLLSVDQKKAIVDELAGFTRQLRELEPPQKGIVASADLNSCVDYRIGTRPVGPFSSHEEFHTFLRGNIPLEDCGKVYGQQVLQCHSNYYRTCFTHSDLTQRNIIVDNGRIVAIIDWAFSGWYPEYWEYTKGHYGLLNIADWYSEFERAMPRYNSELEAERSLWTQFDEPGNQIQL